MTSQGMGSRKGKDWGGYIARYKLWGLGSTAIRLWLTICKFALLFALISHHPAPIVLWAQPFMFNYQQVVLLSFLVFFLLVALSLTPFARGRLLLQVVGLLPGGAAAPSTPPLLILTICFHCSMSAANYAQMSVSGLFCFPSLSSFPLVVLSLTPFVQFFKWLVCFWGGCRPPQPHRF